MKTYHQAYCATQERLYNILRVLSCTYFDVAVSTGVPSEIVKSLLYGDEYRVSLVKMLAALRTLGELE